MEVRLTLNDFGKTATVSTMNTAVRTTYNTTVVAKQILYTHNKL